MWNNKRWFDLKVENEFSLFLSNFLIKNLKKMYLLLK